MLEFIQLLNQRYQTVLSQPGNEAEQNRLSTTNRSADFG